MSNVKYITFLLISLSFLGIFVGCQSSSKNDDLELARQEIRELQEQVKRLLDENDSFRENQNINTTSESINSPTPTIAPIPEPTTEPQSESTIQDDATVIFTNKINIHRDTSIYQFSDSVEFNIEATNNTDKDIRGIQGTVEIQDIFGVQIMKLNCDLTGTTISPNETAKFNGLGFDINQFMNDHVKVFTTDFNDLRFVYTIKSIVFADGTIKE